MCGRCGADIGTSNILLGHMTAFVATLAGGVSGIVMGITLDSERLVLWGIVMGVLGMVGALASVRKILRRRAEFPTARARNSGRDGQS